MKITKNIIVISFIVLVIFLGLWLDHMVAVNNPTIEELFLIKTELLKKIKDDNVIVAALGGRDNFEDAVVPVTWIYHDRRIILEIRLKNDINIETLKETMQKRLDLSSYQYKRPILMEIFLNTSGDANASSNHVFELFNGVHPPEK